MKTNANNKTKKSYIAKQIIIEEIATKIQNSKSIILFEYQGLTVSELEKLRKTFKPLGTELKIYKNTMVNRAVEGSSFKGLQEHLVGANALMFNYENELNGLKDLTTFARKNNKLVLKCGIIDSQILDTKTLITLSKLPNKLGLVSMFMSCLQSPVKNFMNVLNAVADSKSA